MTDIHTAAYSYLGPQSAIQCLVLMRSAITPRACARGKAIGFVSQSVVVTKITRSPHLGTWATRKYDETVEIGDKLASICFESIGKPHECHKYRTSSALLIIRHPFRSLVIRQRSSHLYAIRLIDFYFEVTPQRLQTILWSMWQETNMAECINKEINEIHK